MGIVLVVLVLAIAQLAASSAMAQKFDYFNRNSKLMVGVGTALGTQSFAIKSDIAQFNNLKGTQDGWESFLIVGRNTVKFRTGFGAFKSSLKDANTIKQSVISGLANVYLLDILGKGKKAIHPYIITGLGVNIYEFSGTAVPKMPLIFSNPVTKLCTCATQLTPPGDPGAPGTVGTPGSLGGALVPVPNEPTNTSEAPESQTAKMTYTRVTTGFGAEASFFKNGRFLTLFGEAKYGIPIGVTTQNPGLNNTQMKNQMAVTFGVAFGISNSTSKGFKNVIR